MIIRMGRPLANNHMDGQASFKWSFGGTGLLQMIIRRGRHLANPQLRAKVSMGLNSLCCSLCFTQSYRLEQNKKISEFKYEVCSDVEICFDIILPIIPLEQQLKIVTPNKVTQDSQKGLKISNKWNFALFWPICFFVVANLSTILNTFTVLNNAVVAQNRQISGKSATLWLHC